MIHLVTIKEKVQLYKGEEPANAIELVKLEEFGFTLVAQKDLYQVGDKAVFIEPDYNLPDNSPLFDSFTKPNGDPKKSKLGKRNRIRAIKFNLHAGDGNPVYSNGILLPTDEVFKFIPNSDWFGDLGIYKYEEPETNSGTSTKQGKSEAFPQGLKRSDETNFNKVNWEFPLSLVGQLKCDGSSVVVGYLNGEGFICSRNLKKPLTYKKKVGFKTGFWSRIFSWFGYDRAIYMEVASESEFVTVGKRYLEVLETYCKEPNRIKEFQNLALRGELVGKGASNGSGNKNNPHSNVEPQILFYGCDIWREREFERLKYLQYMEIIGDLGFKTPDIIFDKTFNNREELIQECENYFKDNLVEGIVVRSQDGKLSAKIMNLEYDSKK